MWGTTILAIDMEVVECMRPAIITVVLDTTSVEAPIMVVQEIIMDTEVADMVELDTKTKYLATRLENSTFPSFLSIKSSIKKRKEKFYSFSKKKNLPLLPNRIMEVVAQ